MVAEPTLAMGNEPLDLSSLCLAITEHAPLPMATVEGASHIVRYVNPAFCRLMDKPTKQLVGKPFHKIMPKKDKCVTLLDRVFRTGKPASHTEQQPSKPHSGFWSYTVWPVIAAERPVGVMLQVTETAQFHEKAVAMNEALILGSLHQHELTDTAENLNAQLRAEITERKRAEKARRRIVVLSASNLKLEREIVRREAVEKALKNSELHQRRLLEQSHQMQEQLRHLSHQILQAQEEERKRISRELHDEITQTLVGINVHLETLAQDAMSNPKGLKQGIAKTRRLVENSVNIVHQFARELRPTVLDDLGLIPTLHSYMKDFMERTGIRVRFTTFAGVERLSGAKRTVLFRVAQEGLTNVARHAHASRVDFCIEKLRRFVCLTIKDDGKSFQVQPVLQTKKPKRLGLLGMRERVEMVGGRLTLESARGKGTTVRACIPFSNGDMN